MKIFKGIIIGYIVLFVIKTIVVNIKSALDWIEKSQDLGMKTTQLMEIYTIELKECLEVIDRELADTTLLRRETVLQGEKVARKCKRELIKLERTKRIFKAIGQ